MNPMEELLEKCMKSGNAIHHSTKYKMDGSRRLWGVQMSDFDELNKYHFTFEIAASMMRKNPTSLHHFAQTRKGKRFKIVLDWFLDYMNAFIDYQDKKAPLGPGAGVIAFMEWSTSSRSTKKKLHTSGWRIHVFIDRAVNEMDVLRKYFKHLKKESAKCVKAGLPVPPHYNINTYRSYGSDVFRPYSGKVANFQELFNPELTSSEASPSSLFKMREMPAFEHSVGAYTVDGSFVFPSMNFVLLDSEQLSWENFSMRKLPDYALHSLFKPEVFIHEVEGGMYRLDFGAHRNYKDIAEEWQEIDENALRRFMQQYGRKYLIWREGDTYADPLGELTYSEELHDCEALLSKDPDDFTGKAHVERAEMALCQAAESEIDMIRLEMLQIQEDRAEAGDAQLTPQEKFSRILSEWRVRVWDDPDAFVSDPLLAAIEWFHKGYDSNQIQPKHLVHPDISVFGHSAVCKMIQYETLYQVASAHRECYWLLHARNDAFRHEHNLHLNAMFIGDAATSKSFLQTQIEENSIGKTTKSLTYSTTRSGAVDHDDNHSVRQFDEAPPQFLKDQKNKDAEPALKMMLVKGFQAHERPHSHKDTGVRNKIVGISSCIGVMFGASNEGKGAFSDALRDRFHFFEAEKCIERKDRKTIQASKQMWKSMKAEQKSKHKEAIEDHKFEQGFVCLAWQFIRMGAIKKPDASIVPTIMARFGEELTKYGIRYDTRQWERVELLCSLLAIVRAKDILYKTVTGKYANQPFQCEHLFDAEPLMVCTEEIVLHAIGLEFDTVVPKAHTKTLEAIWKMHTSQGEGASYKMKGQEPDYNYIELSGCLKTISKKIFNAIKESDKHASLCNVESTLVDMKNDMQIKCVSYRKEGNSAQFNDQFPETMLGDTVKQSYDQLNIDGNKLHVHIHMFRDIRRNIKDNIYKKVVSKLKHKFTARKKIVLGMNLPSEPYYWDTVQYEPTDHVITLADGPAAADPLYSQFTGVMEDSSIEIEEDLDVFAARHRSTKIGRQVEPYKPNPYDYAQHLKPYPRRPNKRTHLEMINDDHDMGI